MSTGRIENSGSFQSAGTQIVGSSINTNSGDIHFHASSTVRDTKWGSDVSAHGHWMVPRAANPLFTGRTDLLQDLEKTIRDRVSSPRLHAPCQIVILGMGGQGKSEICLQLARRLRPVFWAVLWVDVSTRDIAERSFMEVAHKLLIPAQQWEDARHRIANLAHPWLLVLDNADEPDVDYQEYFPEGVLGTVVMTTRNEECQQYGTERTITLTGLEISEARDLLLKATRIPSNLHSIHDRDAIAVADLLLSHPLALVQAGAYVSRGHCTLAEYPRLYKRQRRQLLTFRPAQAQSRYRDVYATFEVSAAMLAAAGTQAAQDALDLLPLLAVCGPNHLPIALFQAAWQGAEQVPLDLNDQAEDQKVTLLTPWHVANLPAFIDVTGDSWDSFRLTEAMALLKMFSLVSSSSLHGVPAVSVHPLVHAWARDRQDEDRQHETWLQMGCVVALALEGGNLSPGDQRSLQSHVEALVDWNTAKMFSCQPPKLVARILIICGWYLNTWRADTKLHTLLERLLIHLKMDKLTVNRLWIGLYVLKARNGINHGKVKAAITLLEQIIQIQGQTLAADHRDRLTSQHELAIAYQANGQVKEAVALLEQVVKTKEQTLTADHPSRLVSQWSLATMLWEREEYSVAYEMMRQVVEHMKFEFDEDHPSRRKAEKWLAMMKDELTPEG